MNMVYYLHHSTASAFCVELNVTFNCRSTYGGFTNRESFPIVIIWFLLGTTERSGATSTLTSNLRLPLTLKLAIVHYHSPRPKVVIFFYFFLNYNFLVCSLY